jgi:Uma2 family endonuclease
MSIVQTPSRAQRFRLDGISWRAYEKLLRAFEDERHLRITYDRGCLEIMTLSPRHERPKHLLGQLVIMLALELDMNIAGYGSMTMKRRLEKRGLESDECYWIQNETKVRNLKKFDLNRDPPPDLVLEIDVTHSSLNRLAIYAALRVPEVWRWDEETLQVQVLSAEGQYEIREQSTAFPSFRPADLVRFLKMGATIGETAMLRAFREWIRERKKSRR